MRWYLRRLIARTREPRGLSPSMLYLTRWYSLGERPLSHAAMLRRAAREGWITALDARAAAWL